MGEIGKEGRGRRGADALKKGRQRNYILKVQEGREGWNDEREDSSPPPPPFFFSLGFVPSVGNRATSKCNPVETG